MDEYKVTATIENVDSRCDVVLVLTQNSDEIKLRCANPYRKAHRHYAELDVAAGMTVFIYWE